MKKVLASLVVVMVVLVMFSVQVMAGPSFEYNDCNYNEDCDWEPIEDDECYDWETVDCDEDYSCDEWEEIGCDEDYSCDEWEEVDYDEDCSCDEWEPIEDEESYDWETIEVSEKNLNCFYDYSTACYKTVMSSANVRSGPGTSYCIIGSVSAGDVVAIVGEGDGCDGIHWYLTECGGYIYSGAFEENEGDNDWEPIEDESCDWEPVETETEDDTEYYNAVVICIETQTAKVYKHGECICESSCVTGKEGVSDTPKGEFEICEKAENRYLTGKDYCVPVKYWMEFHEGCGLHDGDNWRSNYGGDIYQSNGSHGCVNLPEYMAESIYKTCPEGTPVIIY